MDAVAPLLPRGLTALTLLINAWVPTITAEAPLKPRQLQQLCALRRLDLRYILRCDDTVSAFLPALPQGLTHLTVGLRHVNDHGDTRPVDASLHEQVLCPR